MDDKKKYLPGTVPIIECPGLHKGMGEESNTTAVKTHVESVHHQSRVLDYLTHLVQRGDLTSNANKRVLFEGETALCMCLATASPIGMVDPKNIQR